jgi:hypothetical protein
VGENFHPSISKQLCRKTVRCQNRGLTVGGTEREFIFDEVCLGRSEESFVVG